MGFLAARWGASKLARTHSVMAFAPLGVAGASLLAPVAATGCGLILAASPPTAIVLAGSDAGIVVEGGDCEVNSHFAKRTNLAEILEYIAEAME